MNNAEQIKALEALAREREQPRKGVALASVRVSPGSYLAMASILTFASALLLRSENDLLAIVTIGIAWLAVPILAFTDRIEFDGTFLSRRGPAPFLARVISGKLKRLRLDDFERVDTHTLRTLRRGGSVRYRFRTQIVGKEGEFCFASGGRSYREMVRRLFPLIHPDKLDLRSLELRDYLCEPKSLNAEVRTLRLASPDVLEGAKFDFKLGGRKPATSVSEVGTVTDGEPVYERARLMGGVANKLRIAGRLNEAREAFRRALLVIPQDGKLIFEFARLLRSQSISLSDAKLLRRSRAALRLAAIRAGSDPGLLAMIGESFLEWGEVVRASKSFQRAVDLQPSNFRARLGLANLALREGKLAHVIHQYRDAANFAAEKALRAYARREGDYYALLNDDDDYLSAELRRINWLQHALRVRRPAARLTNASILLALLTPYVSTAAAGFCWAIATSSLIAWISSLLALRFLGGRRSPRLPE